MDKARCKKCGKEIEGFNRSHAEFLLMQHMLKHRNEEKQSEVQNERNKY